MANEKNLKPFKAGDEWSGNKEGRPKGTKNLKTLIEELGSIEYPTPEELKAMYPNEKYTAKELAIMALFAKSVKGDVQAFHAWADRLEGKPNQTTDVTVTERQTIQDLCSEKLTKADLLKIAGITE
jgi:hypothetical protein